MASEFAASELSQMERNEALVSPPQILILKIMSFVKVQFNPNNLLMVLFLSAHSDGEE